MRYFSLEILERSWNNQESALYLLEWILEQDDAALALKKAARWVDGKVVSGEAP